MWLGSCRICAPHEDRTQRLKWPLLLKPLQPAVALQTAASAGRLFPCEWTPLMSQLLPAMSSIGRHV